MVLKDYIKALQQGYYTSTDETPITELNVSFELIDTASATQLAQGLQRHTHFTHVDLGACHLEDASAALIIHALRAHGSLVSLDLRDNDKLSEQTGNALVALLQHAGSRHIALKLDNRSIWQQIHNASVSNASPETLPAAAPIPYTHTIAQQPSPHPAPRPVDTASLTTHASPLPREIERVNDAHTSLSMRSTTSTASPIAPTARPVAKQASTPSSAKTAGANPIFSFFSGLLGSSPKQTPPPITPPHKGSLSSIRGSHTPPITSSSSLPAPGMSVFSTPITPTRTAHPPGFVLTAIRDDEDDNQFCRRTLREFARNPDISSTVISKLQTIMGTLMKGGEEQVDPLKYIDVVNKEIKSKPLQVPEYEQMLNVLNAIATAIQSKRAQAGILAIKR